MTKNILVIAPHPDDESLALGGVIHKFAQAGDKVTVLTVAGHLPPLYTEQAYMKTIGEAEVAHNLLGVDRSIFLDLPATTLNLMPTHELNNKIYQVIESIEPEWVFIPYPDRHVDHRVIFESAMVCTRPVRVGKKIQCVAAYETLSETHWNASHIEPNFTPNWVVDITDHIDEKLKAVAAYESQIPAFPGPRCLEAIKSLAIFRGTQAGFAFGEALQVIRMVS